MLHDVADFQHLFRNLLWHINLKFHPVGIFYEAQSLEVLLIVGIVVDGGLCAQLVEALNQAPFGVHVGEAERSGDLRHAFAFRPVNHCTIERIHHFLVVDEIDKTKAALCLAGALVHQFVDNASDAAHRLIVAIRHEKCALAKLVSGIFFRKKSGEHIVRKVGNVVLIAFINNVYWKMDKLE